MDDADDISDFLSTVDLEESAPVPPKKVEPQKSTVEWDSPADFMQQVAVTREVPDIIKPWMIFHTFTLVPTIAAFRQIIDRCIESGFCSLDLECQGLDNRIVWSSEGLPSTVHKIVGYCISYDGVEGFYAPVNHLPPLDGGPDLNLDAKLAEAEITRLCKAAIPEGTPEAIAKDPLSYEVSAPPKVVIAFWNAQFDHEFLYPVTGIDWWHPASYEDGMLAAFTKFAADKRIGLKYKAKELLRDKNGNPYEMIELKELFFGKKRAIKFDTLSPDEPGVLRYAGSDAVCTYKLCKLPNLVPLCHAKYNGTYRLEKQVTGVLRSMERNRVRILRDEVKKRLDAHLKLREEVLERIQRFAMEQRQRKDLDPNSPQQLSEFLFEPAPKGMDISPKPERLEKSNQYKTDAETLNELAAVPSAPSILRDIVHFREVEKFIGTYLLGLSNHPDENSELRFSFKQTGAGTGRFSAPGGKADHGYSGIPIHGIPNDSDIRRVFEARDGYAMVKADYAGEELRIAANISGEPVWIDEFLRGTGDLHSITARAFFGKEKVSKDERSMGKTANFALLYGGGPKSIIRATGCDEMEARRRKQKFDAAVKTFASWIKKQHAAVKKELGVWTAFGRWLAIPDARSEDKKVMAACERHAVNYQIQGSGADIMKIALVLLHKVFYKRGWLKSGGGDDSVRMLLTVHDEVVFEIRYDRIAEAIPIIVSHMEAPWRMPRTPGWRIPLVVEPLIGFNWASGFDARHVAPDYEPKPYEVVINGYAYSTKRKPRTDKNGNIIEELDRGEVLDGDMFRVVDPPWLRGFTLGTRVETNGNSTDYSPELPKPKARVTEDIKPVEVVASPQTANAQTPTSEIPSSGLGTTDDTVEEMEVEAPVPERPSPQVGSNGVLQLKLERLNNQTIEQMVTFILNSGDTSGPILHVTDVTGRQTLVSPELKLRVDKDALISRLRKYNLLSLSLD